MSSQVTQQNFAQALQHQQAGRLGEAERLYQLVLSDEPNHANALHLLGLIALNSGRNALAVQLICHAVTLLPDFAEAHNNLGNALAAQGNLEEAICSFNKAIALRPDLSEAYNNLGNTLHKNRQFEAAAEAFHKAVAIKPHFSTAHFNLGNALNDLGQYDEAISAYQRAISLTPDYFQAYYHLGTALHQQGRRTDAIDAYQKAVILRPQYAEAHYRLGNALREVGSFDQSISAYRQALAIKPDFVEAHLNVANSLKLVGQTGPAIDSFHDAIRLQPDFAEAHNNLGIALSEFGALDDAIAAFRHSIALSPDYAEAHYNLSFPLLLKGDFQPGWEEYDWRWKCDAFPSPRRNFEQPQWDGSPLEDCTLLIHAEQGFGDAIQFSRYLPLLAETGGTILFECHPELERLFRTLIGDFKLIPKGGPLPDFDIHCSLMTLPRMCGTTATNIPNAVPYLAPELGLLDAWGQKLGSSNGKLRVGLSWAGNPDFKADRTRSLRLQQLASLAAVQGVQFFSLQKGSATQQLMHLPPELDLVDLSPSLNDFADTAAAMSLLDLIISTDTAIPHLAGALGRPVWVMLQSIPDFRWLLNRDESPWYPSMKLFRQSQPGDWDHVLSRVVDALQAWLT